MRNNKPKTVYLVVRHQEECGCKADPFFDTLDKKVAINTCRQYNKKYGTPELLDVNFDFCQPDDYEWVGGETWYKVMPMMLED